MGISDVQSTLSHIVSLLSPLQDPAKNWEVDLAAHLETFLKELYRLTTESPNGDYKINFVEAAVLIQRSAGIYSKKVEYLWDALMDVLNSFQVKRPGNKSSSSRRKTVALSMEGESNTADTWKPVEDLSFDDQKWKHQPNNFKFEPFIICELEQRMASKLDIELCDRNMDKLGKKSDFRLNYFISSTCMLEDDFSIQTAPVGLFSTLLDVESHIEQNNVNNEPRHSPAHDVGNVSMDNDHYEPENRDDRCLSPELDRLEGEFPAVRHSTVFGTREDVVTVDPWKSDKINEFATKALKAKANFKLPCDGELEKTDRKRKLSERQKEKDIKLMADFLTSDMIKARFSKKAFDSFPRFTVELIDEFRRHKKKLEKERRAEEIEALRIQLATEYVGDFIGFEDYEYSSGEEDGFLGYQDEMPDDDDNADEGGEPVGSEEFPTPQVIDPSSLDNNRESVSYQAVLQEKLNEYFNMGEQLVQSDLAKRVNQWHESIRPVLEAAEKRGHFDIHEYGSRVLECFPQGNRKTTIPFAAVVDGKPKDDVSRYFLSSLMLANSYNIEISKSDPRELAMDCMELTLLNTVRHHEDLQDYEAPSQRSRRSQ
ncbi:condensin-2 complex subunit H2 [Anabrus simplex]|uniref:condensin-2 complex subunit H2 n=1 Tax=Anabrus simplex TaxID=316456 RepID=UPI0035A2E54B